MDCVDWSNARTSDLLKLLRTTQTALTRNYAIRNSAWHRQRAKKDQAWVARITKELSNRGIKL